MVEAACAPAGERGEPPAVGRVWGQGSARDPAGQHDARERAERRDETVGGDSPLGWSREQERQRHDSDERRQHAPCHADEDRGLDAARERWGPDVPVADMAPQHPAPGGKDQHDRQQEREDEQWLPVGPVSDSMSRKPLVERRIHQPLDDA